MFESGIGRGMGFRDSNQDLLGFVHMVPERARERILDIAATQLPDGGAYHQYQPLTKRGNDAVGSGFNDDPLWLVLARRGVHQGDGRLRDPRRARAVRQRAGHGDAAARPPAAVRSTSRSSRLGPARPAADRPRRLERLPQPQLLLRHARRVVPDDGEPRGRLGRVGLHRRPVRAGRRRGWRRSPSGAATTRRPPRCRVGGRGDGRGGRRSRLGRRVVPARLRLLRRAGRLGARTTRARSSSSRRGCCVMAGIGLDDGRARPGARRRPRAARDAARHRAAAAGLLDVPGASSARSRRTRPATRRTPASSATPTRG